MLARGNAAQWILEGDICACFDNISQKWLVANTPMDKGMLSKWLKAGYVERNTFHATDAGTAQGGPLSPMLCNLTLDGLEPMLKKRFPHHKVNAIRFADDFVVTGDSKAWLEQDVKPAITAFLAERGLSLSEEKTRIVHIEEGFDFLGQNIRKYHGKLIIKPAKKAVKKLLSNVRGLINNHPTAASAALIEQLNPVIRGWAQYHRHACSKQTFSTVDSQIFRALWRWAKRRHPNQPRRWIKQRYFTRQGGNQWVFAGRTKDNPVRTLFRAAALPIRRHIKVRMEANPYDPADERYFEKRLVEKWKSGRYGHTRAKQLWLTQQGRCPRCSHLITEETGCEVHHKILLAEGGPDTMDNLVLLHPTCHRQLHARKKTTSPALTKRALKGLSGVKGNFHAPFLEGRVGW
ncbi:MAG: group II intron reverse transcriptase/maturase [Rhodobacteraceae bacterium]|nr:group II intron reverse transcriptase/maturase [Paracoccaceae bacterium]